MKAIFRACYFDQGRQHKDFWPKDNETAAETLSRAKVFMAELKHQPGKPGAIHMVNDAGEYVPYKFN